MKLHFLLKHKISTCGILIVILILLLNVTFEIYSIHLLQKDESRFKVLTYNIHSIDNGFDNVASKIANSILKENPAFIFLTEYYETSSDAVDSLLSDRYPYSDVSHRTGNDDGDVFYSKWPMDSISPKIMIPGHYHSLYRVQIHIDTDTIVIYCCHLSSNNMKLKDGKWASLQEGWRLRHAEADTIYNAIQKERHPVIVIGDMNDISGSYTIRKLESARLSDAWWKGGWGYGSTFHDGILRLRLDHILYDDKHLQLRNVKVVGDNDWSDHNAVVAGFGW